MRYLQILPGCICICKPLMSEQVLCSLQNDSKYSCKVSLPYMWEYSCRVSLPYVWEHSCRVYLPYVQEFIYIQELISIC